MQLHTIWLLTFSVLLLTPFLVGNNVSAEDDDLVISLNKESYAAGETITVTGHVSGGDIGPVILQVISPNGNVAHIAQITPDSEDNFSEDVSTSIAGQWKETGTYIIKATHLYATTQLQFEYGGLMQAQVKPSTDIEDTSGDLELSPLDEFSNNVVIIKIEDYDVHYKITGGKVLKIIPDTENTSLIIQIETFNDGELTITLPKEIIDTNEGSFFVLVDGEETIYYSEETSDTRTLLIPFYNGSEVIEIIGTFVIPEFGTIAAIILAVAITSIIVLSAKTRLNIMPR
jgi:predicted secreted protein with PEFG-CTERM motif